MWSENSMERSVDDPVEVIRREIETGESPLVELDCLATADAEQNAEWVARFCNTNLRSGIRGYFFYRPSVGSAHGIRLDDGCKVVIKVRPPPETEEKIVATYDWDSLSFQPETELIGLSAHGFTADWTLEGVRRISTADDIRADVADYGKARGRPFSKHERRSLFAHCVYSIAYGAHCAHSLEPKKTTWGEDTFPYLLRTDGQALLREAVN
jgi:hypothetical protein